MRLAIHSQNLQISREREESIERRLRFVLGRFDNRIVRVSVHLAGLNDPPDGMNLTCRIEVRLLPAGQVFIEDSDVDRAADRVAKAVGRELDRQRELETGTSSLQGRSSGKDPQKRD